MPSSNRGATMSKSALVTRGLVLPRSTGAGEQRQCKDVKTVGKYTRSITCMWAEAPAAKAARKEAIVVKCIVVLI